MRRLLRIRAGAQLQRWLLVGVFLALFVGCTATVPIEPTLQAPLVERLPITVGVYYSPKLRGHVYETDAMCASATFIYPLGPPSMALFDEALEDMFAGVVMIETPSALREAHPDIVGALAPEISYFRAAALGGWCPRDGNLAFLPVFSAEIGYRAVLYDSTGRELGAWSVDGEARIDDRWWTGLEPSLHAGDATELAMQNAAAVFLAGFREQPPVQRWLEDLGLGPEVPASD